MLHKCFGRWCNLNKKSMSLVELIMWLGIIAIAAFVLLKFFIKTSSEFGTFSSSELLKAKDSKCLLDMQRDLERGLKPTDTDLDGRPDYCDSCFSYTSKQGNNKEDNDGDGIPTYCDKDDSPINGKTIVACKSSFTTTNDGRCIEGGEPATRAG